MKSERNGEFMKVRVKKGKIGFIYDSLRKEGAEFTLKTIFEKDGKTVKKSVEDQFSKVWMESREKPKAKPGPKP